MPCKPSKRQLQILTVLCQVAREQATTELKYVTEWLGYLPFGQYHWIEIGKERAAESRIPTDWAEKDLDALKNAGLLELIEYEAGDDMDATSRYRITEAGFLAAEGVGA